MANKSDKQMTYEELERYCEYLSQQVTTLSETLKQSQFSEMVARLNFEFKVLEFPKLFPKDYVEKCVTDIQRILLMEEPEAIQKEEADEANA